jgi:hypothetical protein
MSPSCRNLPFSTILDKIFITIYLHIKPDYKISPRSSNPNSDSCRNLPFWTILHKISSPSIYTLNLTVKLHPVPQTLILLLVEIFFLIYLAQSFITIYLHIKGDNKLAPSSSNPDSPSCLQKASFVNTRKMQWLQAFLLPVDSSSAPAPSLLNVHPEHKPSFFHGVW